MREYTSRIGRRDVLAVVLAGGAALGVLGLGAAWAHHGWGGYDADNKLTLTGTIVEAIYANPHGTMRLQTPDKIWTVVLAPPSRLERRGVTPEMLAVGATAAVEGYPSKSEPEELRAERITLGGHVFEMR
jgi:hypothetical protein